MQKVLDLHGKTHAEAKILVEEFILKNSPPMHLITGNSNAMKEIVENLLEKHGFKRVTFSHNLGEIIAL